jgi:TolA-binding protein
MNLTRFSPLAMAIVFSFSLFMSGCLKSRVQLNKDEDDTQASIPTKVTDVRTPEHATAMDEMRSEINRLNSKIEELERSNRDLNSDLSKQSKTKTNEATQLEDRIHELELAQAQMIEALKKKEKEPSMKAADQGAVLKKAERLFEEKGYSEVIDLLVDYTKNPKNPKQEEAYFLRGESYFAQKQYKKAILDYSAITEKFPKSKRAPLSLSRIAKSFEKLGMKSDAKVFYQELQDKYPQSAEAKAELKKLN